jgi:phage tail tube protein FII
VIEMRIKYKDINTGEIKKAEYLDYDYILDHTRLKDENGNVFVVAKWQLV